MVEACKWFSVRVSHRTINEVSVRILEGVRIDPLFHQSRKYCAIYHHNKKSTL